MMVLEELEIFVRILGEGMGGGKSRSTSSSS